MKDYGSYCFSNIKPTAVLLVPNGSVSEYKRISSYFKVVRPALPPTITVTTYDENVIKVTGSGTYDFQENVTITAIPQYGYSFARWNDGNTDNPRTIVAVDDKTYSVSAQKNKYKITISTNDENRGKVLNRNYNSINGQTLEYSYQGTVELHTSANTGYHFARWSDGNTDNPRTLLVERDSIIVAEFEKNSYNLSYNTSIGGKSTGPSTALYKDTIEISAEANYGYHFTTWSDGNAENPRKYEITSSKTFYANFALNSYNVNVVYDENMGSATGEGSYLYGKQVNISASSKNGYHFVKWSDGETKSLRYFKIDRDTTFTAEFAKDTFDICVYNNGNFEHTKVAYLDTIMIEAGERYGLYFTNWDDGNTDNPRQIVVTQDKTYTPSYGYCIYNVNASCDETMGSVNGSGTYYYLRRCDLSALAKNGYHFVQWSNGVTTAFYSFVVTKDSTLVAEFAKNSYTIKATPYTSDCTTTGSCTALYQDTIMISAEPAYGYDFSKWSDGNTDNPRQVIVSGNFSVVAYTSRHNFDVSVTCDETMGRVYSSSNASYYQDKRTITAQSNTGYHFVQWSDGVTESSRTITIEKDSLIVAQFAKNEYTLTPTAQTGGSVSAGGTALYQETIELSATADEGYHFVQWSDGVTTLKRTVVMTQDSALVAEFAKNSYSISVSCDETMGQVTFSTGAALYQETVEISATADEGYIFTQWSDGNTENPRKLVITDNLSLTAEFAVDPTGLDVITIAPTVTKVIRNGEVHIMRGNQMYNLRGQKVQ